MIAIHTSFVTPRLSYSLDLIFLKIFKIPFELNPTEKSSFDFHIYYGKKGAESFQLTIPIVSTILKDDSVVAIDSILGPNKTLFPSAESDFNFDIFSAAFYVASRYEEYLPSVRDQHNRFQAKQSILHQLESLELPIIQEWAVRLQKAIQKINPQISFRSSPLTIVPTVDIDQYTAFSNKTFRRLMGGIANDFLRLNLRTVARRLSVLINRKKDPYDTYLYMESQFSANDLVPLYFVLMGTYGSFDKNVSVSNGIFKAWLNTFFENRSVGAHPSYGSHQSQKHLSEEIALLSKLTNQSISRSRQHFVKMELPITYRNLLSQGIFHDFSMGYAEQIGFRAGLSIPFKWFDLEQNQVTELTIHPFCMMDVTLKNYLNLDVKGALTEVEKMKKTLQIYGGTFSTIWHNSSFAEHEGWKGWDEVFEATLKMPAS